MIRRVLVTRPEPGATATANALRAAGFEPIILSLTEIVPLPVVGELDVSGITAVAVTSANALRCAPERLLSQLADLPLFAVGGATAKVAEQAGFRNVVAGPGDAAGLAGLLRDRASSGSTILYLCGKLRRPDFERAVESGGLKISVLETYDTRKPASDTGFLPILEAGSPLFAVLLHSSEAAKTLSGLMSQSAVASLVANALVIAISDRAVAPIQGAFPERTRVAREPNDPAMISALRAAS